MKFRSIQSIIGRTKAATIPTKPNGRAIETDPFNVARADTTISRIDTNADPRILIRSLASVPACKSDRICCSFSAIPRMRSPAFDKTSLYFWKDSGGGRGPENCWLISISKVFKDFPIDFPITSLTIFSNFSFFHQTNCQETQHRSFLNLSLDRLSVEFSFRFDGVFWG